MKLMLLLSLFSSTVFAQELQGSCNAYFQAPVQFVSGGKFDQGVRVNESGNYGGTYFAQIQVQEKEMMVVEKPTTVSTTNPDWQQNLQDVYDLHELAHEKKLGAKIYGYKDLKEESEVHRLIYMEAIGQTPYMVENQLPNDAAYWMKKVDKKTLRYQTLVSEENAKAMAEQLYILSKVHPDFHLGNVLFEFSESNGQVSGQVLGIDWDNPLSRNPGRNSVYKLKLRSEVDFIRKSFQTGKIKVDAYGEISI